jgi:hypothetical protein
MCDAIGLSRVQATFTLFAVCICGVSCTPQEERATKELQAIVDRMNQWEDLSASGKQRECADNCTYVLKSTGKSEPRFLAILTWEEHRHVQLDPGEDINSNTYTFGVVASTNATVVRDVEKRTIKITKKLEDMLIWQNGKWEITEDRGFALSDALTKKTWRAYNTRIKDGHVQSR